MFCTGIVVDKEAVNLSVVTVFVWRDMQRSGQGVPNCQNSRARFRNPVVKRQLRPAHEYCRAKGNASFGSGELNAKRRDGLTGGNQPNFISAHVKQNPPVNALVGLRGEKLSCWGCRDGTDKGERCSKVPEHSSVATNEAAPGNFT
jgi:hypothetical protein